MTSDALYPIIHFKDDELEIALTHADQNNEEYYSFVNGQNTSLGGPHQTAFREAIGKTIKEFFNKNLAENLKKVYLCIVKNLKKV